MTQRQSFWVLVMHTLVAVALVGAATALCATSKLDAAAVTGIFGAVLGFVGGAGITQGQAIINGGPKADLTKLFQADPAAYAQLMTKQPAPVVQPVVAAAAPAAPAAAPIPGTGQGA